MEQRADSVARERVTTSMPRGQVRDQLRSVALFRGMDDADLDRVLEICEPVLVEAGETLFEEGERGDQFFVVLQGEIELKKRSGGDSERLAVLRAGQAFGEMALLNQTPRSASARARTDTYLLSVSRGAFAEMLGGETVAVRLLRNLSKALWATSVRLAAQQARARRARPDGVQEGLARFNRLLHSRILPRVTPRVSGFDLSAGTFSPPDGSGASAWDWFLLADGRPAFVVMKAVRADVFSAQRLAAVRGVMRTLGEASRGGLGALMTRANDGLRSGWVDGLSGPVDCAMIALTDGGAEIASAGDSAAVVAHAGGEVETPVSLAPALGERGAHDYGSSSVSLQSGDRVILLSDALTGATGLVAGAARSSAEGSRETLTKLVAALGERQPKPSDFTGAVISRTGQRN